MDEDIYYVDTRNAEPIVVSRTYGPGQVPGGVPGRVIGVTRSPRVVTPVATPGGRYGSMYGNPYAGSAMTPYGSPYGAPIGASLGGLFGGMTGGQLVDLVAQIFAAVMPLPTAPTATSDPATDVPNMILFTNALAQYAKRDEQIRTLGSLVTKLLG
ncbi:MAG TPA: hypothetical protein VGL61_09605 [Kofleriaceae bacterium]|jgi:hypothetical protein